jgi:hypothetical protein
MNNINTILIYSKYSQKSTEILDLIQSASNEFVRDFSLQFLCIDNEKIRKRIMSNKQIQIITVPSILKIYSDGGVEQYNGGDWVMQNISRYLPQAPRQTQPYIPELSEEEKYELKQKAIKEHKELLRKETEEENKRKYFERQEKSEKSEKSGQDNESRDKPKKSETTSIDDLPSDEEDQIAGDRYRGRKPIGTIREDSGNYKQEDSLFQGSPPDMRQSKRSAVKKTSKQGKEKVDILAKAQELAKSREMDNNSQPDPRRKI